MKYYFETLDSEICYNKKGMDQIMKDRGVTTLTVFKANRIINDDAMYCKKYGEVGEKGHCGRDCEFYKPRNGISGNCVFTGTLYDQGEETVIKLIKPTKQQKIFQLNDKNYSN